MKRPALLLLTLATLALTGCGDNHDKTMGQTLQCLRKINAILTNVKDETGAKVAAIDLQPLIDELAAIEKREKALGPPSQAEEAQLTKKYGQEMTDVFGTFMANMTRISLKPELRQPLEKTLNKLNDSAPKTPGGP